MKKVLITGKNSYIGNSVENWLMKEPDNYTVDKVDMKDEAWKEKDFSPYDVVFHVAGIAHVSSDPKMEDIYYKVNRDLTVQAARKAKAEGVKQFIFMSSIIVYGDSSNRKRIIDKNTVPNPSNFYGDSKLQAEQGISNLQTDEFNVAILRPPMIYGKNSKGNFKKLSKLSCKTPIFPLVYNNRSMLYVDNLCEFIKLIIAKNDSGLYFPQNKEYVNTSKLVKEISKINGRKIWITNKMNFIIYIFSKTRLYKKIFGNLVYDKSLSNQYFDQYQVVSFEESIKLSKC